LRHRSNPTTDPSFARPRTRHLFPSLVAVGSASFLLISLLSHASQSTAQPKEPTESQTELLASNAIVEHLDIPYDQIRGVAPNLLSLDIYAPAASTDCPVVVMIHGGGWHEGDKANRAVVEAKSRHFVGAGCVFVSANYRLSPAVRHPEHVKDIAKALAWIHDHIADHGGDPNRMYVMGHSAGAHLAALVATDDHYLAALGKDLRILKGVILLDSAAYDIPRFINELGGARAMRETYENAFGTDEEIWRDASPQAHVKPGKHIPPFLIFHTGARLAGATLSKDLAESLRKAGTPAWAIHARDKDHRAISLDIGRPDDWVTNLIMKFLHDDLPVNPAEILPPPTSSPLPNPN